MSHCSKFNISFKDKHILFKAMRNLNMNPENQIWAAYQSKLGKKIGFHGTPLGKLLTGKIGDINLIFMEENESYVLNVESHKLSVDRLQQESKSIIQALQKEYVMCSLEKLKNSIIQAGESASLTKSATESADIYTLEVGTYGRKMIVLVNNNGEISEEVHGVTGKSCTDLTSIFESCVTESIQREWTPEYSETVEDQEIQVLHLT